MLYENKQLIHICLLRSYLRNIFIISLLSDIHFTVAFETNDV